jgi:hypothetical protein
MALIGSFVTAATCSGKAVQVSNRQSLPSEIALKCNTPASWVTLEGDEVYVQVSPQARYEDVNCVIAELRRRHVENFGFIGNAARPN